MVGPSGGCSNRPCGAPRRLLRRSTGPFSCLGPVECDRGIGPRRHRASAGPKMCRADDRAALAEPGSPPSFDVLVSLPRGEACGLRLAVPSGPRHSSTLRAPVPPPGPVPRRGRVAAGRPCASTAKSDRIARPCPPLPIPRSPSLRCPVLLPGCALPGAPNVSPARYYAALVPMPMTADSGFRLTAHRAHPKKPARRRRGRTRMQPPPFSSSVRARPRRQTRSRRGSPVTIQEPGRNPAGARPARPLPTGHRRLHDGRRAAAGGRARGKVDGPLV